MDTSVIIILLLLMGAMAAYVPVYMSLFFTGILGFVFFAPDTQTLMLVQSFFKSMDNFALVVVLFFILCGNIMTAGTIVEKLIKMVNTLVSWLPGGLGMAGCLGCGLFGAISGSTVATVVALGGFMIPALIKNGYSEKYSVGLMTTAPNLGIIIPPSISMILYAMITNVSLQGLFLTGFIPGIFIMGFTCIYTYFLFKDSQTIVRMPVPSFGEVVTVFKEGFWSLMLPVIIFVGHFLRRVHGQRSRGGGLHLRLLCGAFHPQIHEVQGCEESHRRLGRDLGDAAHHRGRRHLFRPLPDL